MLGQTWRSVASVIIAYILVVILFFYGDWLLNDILNVSNSIRDFMRAVVGDATGAQGNFLFTVFFSEGTFFITLMILLARVLVLSLFLWIGQAIVHAMFGKA
jgi:hypothetical protein